jgi:hypothetical protein
MGLLRTRKRAVLRATAITSSAMFLWTFTLAPPVAALAHLRTAKQHSTPHQEYRALTPYQMKHIWGRAGIGGPSTKSIAELSRRPSMPIGGIQ